MRIYLIGFMGSGKTTVGRQVAGKLNYVFEDLDEHIERNYKTSIPLIFEKYDESAFRRLEQDVLHKTAGFNNTVIATGGGTPCFFDNMTWMNNQGLTIYLKLHPKSLYNRIIHSKKVRPLVRQRPPSEWLTFIEEKLSERDLFYRQASIIIKGENLDVNKLVDEIVKYKNNNE
ncbi:MAG: shikimate kinase [Bacteroidetes bacterium]|nr:shikimate kinase [Bacteroidota bacterium]